MQRPLWQTLVDVIGSVSPDAGSGIRVTHAHLDLPIEVRFVRTASGYDFLADLPRWRWRTAFDRRSGRLKLDVSEGQS